MCRGNSKFVRPPVSVLDVIDEASKDKANLIQHDIELTAGQGRTAKTNSYKIQMYALDDTKSILTYLTWRENLEELIIAKGAETDFSFINHLVLSVIKGFPKAEWKKATGLYGCTSQETYDKCICELSKMFLSEDSIDDQTEYIRTIRKPRALQIKPFVARLRTLIMLRKYMKVSPDQDIPIITELELIRLVHNACPELWRNSLKRSNSKLVDMSMEQLVRYMEEFDDVKPDPKPGYSVLRGHQDAGRIKNKNEVRASEFCKHHGHGNHTTYDCDIERRKREQMKQRGGREKWTRDTRDGRNRNRDRERRDVKPKAVHWDKKKKGDKHIHSLKMKKSKKKGRKEKKGKKRCYSSSESSSYSPSEDSMSQTDNNSSTDDYQSE